MTLDRRAITLSNLPAMPTVMDEFIAPKELDGVALRLPLNTLEVPLLPRPASENRVDGLWHRVEDKPGFTLSLSSRSEEPRILRLMTRSDAPGWDTCRLRFSYAVRRAAESTGNEAVRAQDALQQAGAALQLLLLPGETREVKLAPLATLDDEAIAGNYEFSIVVSDARSGGDESSYSLEATLCLRHPPSTLLRRLPSIYTQALATQGQAENELGPGRYREPSFFERFLRGFEDASLPLESLLANLERFYGPDTAPPEFLPWLATWVALVLDENWPELKRRRLIREAVELFRWRGTRRGLARYLEIYAGVTPEINDQPFQGMRLGMHALGAQAKLGNVPSHTFVVTLAVDDPDDINERIVRDIIESVKPAHTAYALRIVHRATRHHMPPIPLTEAESAANSA